MVKAPKQEVYVITLVLREQRFGQLIQIASIEMSLTVVFLTLEYTRGTR